MPAHSLRGLPNQSPSPPGRGADKPAAKAVLELVGDVLDQGERLDEGLIRESVSVRAIGSLRSRSLRSSSRRKPSTACKASSSFTPRQFSTGSLTRGSRPGHRTLRRGANCATRTGPRTVVV